MQIKQIEFEYLRALTGSLYTYLYLQVPDIFEIICKYFVSDIH